MLCNNIKLVGRLNRLDVKEGNTKDGRPYITATLTLRVGENDIQTRMFSMKYKANGDEQTAYKGIMTIYNEGKALYKSYTIEDVKKEESKETDETIIDNIEECEVIKLSSYGSYKYCRFQTNMYMSKDGNIAKAVNIEFNYCNRGSNEDEEKNYFEVVGIVKDAPVEIEDKYENPMVKFTVLVPTFNKGYNKTDGTKVEDSIRLDEIEMVSHDESVFDYIMDNFGKGEIVSLNGEIVRVVTRIEVEAEPEQHIGFGRQKEVEPQFRTDVDSYFEVLGGFTYDMEEVEETNEFKQELIEKALEELKIKEEELKQGETKEQSVGFGRPSKPSKPSKPNNNRMPFNF